VAGRKVLAVIQEYKAEIYRKKKTAIPGNEFGSNNSEAMRVAHSSLIRFRMDFGMRGGFNFFLMAGSSVW